MEHQYRVVDVFTEKPLEGNPLAVFSDGTGLDDAIMQSIARELNLSETVFVLPPAQPDSAGHSVARLRIFTPFHEMDFAGHPTIGAAFVLLDDGAVPSDSENFVLEENVGLVPIRVERGKRPLIWLTTPPIQDGPIFERSLCAEVLGIKDSDMLDTPPQLLSAGNPTVFIAVKDRAAVDRAEMETTGVKLLRGTYPKPICTFVFTPTAEGAYSRMFARELGVVEDPATGSATGPLASYMLRHKLVSGARFISEQGTKMRRRSLLHVQVSGNQIEVGGYVTPLVRAVMEL